MKAFDFIFLLVLIVIISLLVNLGNPEEAADNLLLYSIIAIAVYVAYKCVEKWVLKPQKKK